MALILKHEKRMNKVKTTFIIKTTTNYVFIILQMAQFQVVRFGCAMQACSTENRITYVCLYGPT